MIVAAAGNEGQQQRRDPVLAMHPPNPNIVCVAAVDDQSELASYSNYGAGER